MPDATSSRQLFDSLRARLSSLSEALFEKASFSRFGQSNFRDSGPRLLTLCRGLGSIDIVLQELERRWHRLSNQDQDVFWDEWDRRLDRLLRDAREQCNLCLVTPGSGLGRPAAAYDCSVCGIRVAHLAEELESWASRFTDRLELSAPVHTTPAPAPAAPVPAPAPAPTPTPEQPAPAPTPAPDTNTELTTAPTPDEPAKPPEPEAKPGSASKAEADETIKGLEAKCQDYSDILEQTQTALQTANEVSKTQEENTKTLIQELEALQKTRDELQQTCDLLEVDLREAVGMLEKDVEELDEQKQWYTAQLAYAVITKLIRNQLGRIGGDAPEAEQQRQELEVKALKLTHKRAVALMKIGSFQEAEALAGEVWQKRNIFTGEGSRDLRRTLTKDYCDILCKNRKHDEAEKEYRLILLNELFSTTDREDEEWRFTISSRLGDLYHEQRRFMEAAMQHRQALDTIMRLQPLDADRAAECACKCLRAQRTPQDNAGFTIVDNTIGTHYEAIWNHRRVGLERADMLSCGHEYGIRLFSEGGRDEEAASVLSAVWERRRALTGVVGVGAGAGAVGGDPHREAAMETALLLVDLSVKTENLPRLEQLYHWVTQNPTAAQTESDRVWARYRLGAVQAVLEKYAIAEDSLRRALTRQTELFGTENPDTLQFTQVLAEVVRRDSRNRRSAEAAELVKGIWEGRAHWDVSQRSNRGVVQALMRIGHIYGDVLCESNEAKDLEKAEAVLKEVWETTSSNLLEPEANRLAVLVSSGDCYALSVMKRQRFRQAKTILDSVLQWKRWGNLRIDPSEVERTSYLLNKANNLEIKGNETKKHIKYQPSTVHFHPLKLRFLLDQWWWKPTAVVGYLTNS